MRYEKELDLEGSEMSCIPEKNTQVLLCLGTPKTVNLPFAEIDRDHLSLMDSIRVGDEVAKRWNEHDKLISIIADFVLQNCTKGDELIDFGYSSYAEALMVLFEQDVVEEVSPGRYKWK